MEARNTRTLPVYSSSFFLQWLKLHFTLKNAIRFPSSRTLLKVIVASILYFEIFQKLFHQATEFYCTKALGEYQDRAFETKKSGTFYKT